MEKAGKPYTLGDVQETIKKAPQSITRVASTTAKLFSQILYTLGISKENDKCRDCLEDR